MNYNRSRNPFLDAAEANAQRGLAEGLPIFLTEARRSSPVNATPYLLRYSQFLREAKQWPGGRFRLVCELDAVKMRLESINFKIEAMLVGGSFTELKKPNPGDIDCLIFYRRDEEADPSELAEVQLSAKAKSVDCRLIPIDGDPLALLKITSYFTILYSKHKSSNEVVRCLLLLDCREHT